MPWCEECSKYWTPNSLEDDGSCPTCGDEIASQASDTSDEKAPWHFKLMIAALVAYLGWRVVELF